MVVCKESLLRSDEETVRKELCEFVDGFIQSLWRRIEFHKNAQRQHLGNRVIRQVLLKISPLGAKEP